MAKQLEIQQLRLQKKNATGDLKGKKERGSEDYGGRKIIIILFLLTIGLSLLFWFQSNFSSLLRDVFGPSTWTFSR